MSALQAPPAAAPAVVDSPSCLNHGQGAGDSSNQQQQQQPRCASAAAAEFPMPSSSATAAAGSQDAEAAAAALPLAPRMRRVSSTPAFRAPCFAAGPPAPRGCGCGARGGAACGCLEVYVVSRAFTEFGGGLFKRLTPGMKLSMVDLGICHYMTVFRAPDGRLYQFDFGPRGGDVEKVNGPLAGLLRAARQQQQHAASSSGGGGGESQPRSSGGGMRQCPSAPALEMLAQAQAAVEGAAALQQQQQQQQKGAVGEIREAELDALPAAHLYVGRTGLTLEDVRRYNSGQAKLYRLHENDCRHYVNQLVQYATGVEHSTQHLKRHHFRSRFEGRNTPWHGWFVEAGQLATDVGNWGRLQAGGAAALLTVTGRVTLAHLKAFAALAYAKGAGAGLLGAIQFGPPLLPVPLQLPPVLQFLRSAQIHITGALTAAAAAGAPGGAAAAAAVAGAGGAVGTSSAAAVPSAFGGFGVFASSLHLPSILMSPSAVVAATVRRPLTGGAVAAAGAGAVALGGGAGPDGAAAGRQFAAALSTSGRGAVARMRDQVGRGLTGAALALQRMGAGAGAGGGWTAPSARQQAAGSRLAIVAGATGGSSSGSSVAGQTAAAPPAGLFQGFVWLGGSAARLSGAIAAAARQRVFGLRAAPGAASAGAASAGAVSIAALGEQSLGNASVGSLQALVLGGGPAAGGPSGAVDHPASSSSAVPTAAMGVAMGMASTSDVVRSTATDVPRRALAASASAAATVGASSPLAVCVAVRKSASCSSLGGLLLDPVTGAAAAAAAAGSPRATDVGSIQCCGGRQTLHLPAPRLSWLRRGGNGNGALVLRGTA